MPTRSDRHASSRSPARPLRLVACATLSALALIGCGGGGPQPLAISGKVTLDNQPLEKGVITFISASDPNSTAGGVVEKGAYSIPYDDGLHPGTYKVSVIANQPTGREVKDPDNPKSKIAEEIQVIPDRYNRQTQLSAEVKAGASNTFDFELVGSKLSRK